MASISETTLSGRASLQFPMPHDGRLDRPRARRQDLNAMDRTLLAVNEALQSMGSPGFETQSLVWLRERVDAETVKRALAALCRKYPVVASRLVIPRFGRRPFWQFRPNSQCPLHETELQTADSREVLNHAARLLSMPHDLGSTDPIHFHLLHLADGRDVFLVQYNHTLMDNGASMLLLRELDRLSAEHSSSADWCSTPQHDDLIADYLQRFPFRRRLRAALKTANLRLRSLRKATAKFPSYDQPSPHTSLPQGEGLGVRVGSQRMALAGRSLGPEQTLVLEQRARQVCRFPTVSMALLSSVFRGMQAVRPERFSLTDRLIAGLGLDLGLRGERGPLFQNLMSLIPVGLDVEQLANRDELMRHLHRQIRDRLQHQLDLGVVQLASLFQRQHRFVRWSTRRLLQHGYSLWYAYFGSLDAVGHSFCGATIDDLFYTGPCWPAIGSTVIANQFHGRLHIQVTYLPDRVPQTLVDAFLDALIDDATRSE